MKKILLAFLLILLYESLANEDLNPIKEGKESDNDRFYAIIDQTASDCVANSPDNKHCAVSFGEVHNSLKPDNIEDKDVHVQNEDSELQNSSDVIEAATEVIAEIDSNEGTNKTLIEENLELHSNNTTAEGNSTAKVKISKQVNCNITEVYNITDVQIINATQILKLLHIDLNIAGKATSANCHLIYFFSPYCAFSVQGSAYVNALARSIKNVPVFALDSIEHHNLNSRYGVAGTPSLVLFHNGLIVGRYNFSHFSTSNLMSFIHHYTDQKIEHINVTSNDFKAWLPSQVVYTTPYVIYICWIFIIGDILWFFIKSPLYARLTEVFVNNWREAEAQHQHEE